MSIQSTDDTVTALRMPIMLKVENGPNEKTVEQKRSGSRVVFSLASPTVFAAASLLIHQILPNRQISQTTHSYQIALCIFLASGPVMGLLYFLVPSGRRWLAETAPIFAMAIGLTAIWNLITLKCALLPLPYFPGPDAVIAAFVEDRQLLVECTWRTLLLLAAGYSIGAVVGFVTGVMIGWFPRFRYWAMPILKFVGPIPATAWIPLSIMLFPNSFVSGMLLIALAVWFPMTMLTSSGIANVRKSHLEVACTLGASRSFLILHVAIPSAMPNVFIGMFMGLGTAFLTLIAAEAVGVKSGLGWYMDKGRDFADFDKIYAALIITGISFSFIMTLLFRVRDRVLGWQKGVIKW